MIKGHCHCNNVRYELQTAATVESVTLRVCRCDFCLRHRPRYWSDPAGSVAFFFEDPAEMLAYRFGHGTADFVLCRRCGVFCGAIATMDRDTFAVLNMNLALSRHDTPQDILLEALEENREQRSARRRATWTPVTSGWPPG